VGEKDLGVDIHASVDGAVTGVSRDWIEIRT
jgi:hypothetical protein